MATSELECLMVAYRLVGHPVADALGLLGAVARSEKAVSGQGGRLVSESRLGGSVRQPGAVGGPPVVDPDEDGEGGGGDGR